MRIFVEWHDPKRPGWGGYFTSLAGRDFQRDLEDYVRVYGPPTLVQFRADDEGYVEGGEFAEDD